MYELKLLQLNLGHRRAASYDLQLRTSVMDRFICILQEPWVVRNRVRGLDGQHRQIVTTLSEAPPRALIYCHKDAKVSPFGQFTCRDVACGLWDIGMPNLKQIMLISVYWDCKRKQIPQQFLDCLAWCRDNRVPVHVGGDFNAHSTLWGGRSDTGRGYELEKIMFDNNLVLLNEGDIATFCIAGKSSVIDLTMTSPECLEYVSSWGVIVKDDAPGGGTYNGSDHRTIETRYLTTKPEKVFSKSMKNVDWPQFRAEIATSMRNWEIPRTLTPNQLEEEVERWNKAIDKACSKFSTLQVVKPRDPVINLWYTAELRNERKAVASLGRTAVRSGLDEDWAVFRDAQREYSKNLRRAARECYQRFSTDLPSLTDMAKFCRLVRQQPRHDVGVMRRPDGEFSTSPAEALGLVMDNACPDSEEVSPNHERIVRLQNISAPAFTYPELEWMSIGLIRDSLSQFKNCKSSSRMWP